MPVIPASARRRSETPNATMLTSASPSLGGSDDLSLWWVHMVGGASGPPHTFDSEQVWSLVEGEADIELGSETTTLGPGDTIVLPANVVRRVHAKSDLRAVVCGYGSARVTVPGEAGDRGTPEWIS